MSEQHIHLVEPAAVWVPTAELKPWDKNPRKNAEAVAEVAKSIRRFGFGAAIVARLADKTIIAGHTRWLAAKKLGLTQVPVRFLDLDPADAQLLALADNKLGELAEWDDEMLAKVLAELKADNAELSASGFDTAEVDRLLAELNAGNLADVAEPPLPEVPKVARSKRGEVYQLGSHRLMCGDSTSAADVLKLMNGQRAPLCATDPPYLVDYDGGNHPQSFARDEAGKTNNKHWDSYIDPKSSPAAIARLAQLMKQTERPDVAVTAAVALLDRAGVRPWAVDPERLEVMYAGVDSRTILAALLTRRAVAGDVASGAGDAAGDVEPAGS